MNSLCGYLCLSCGKTQWRDSWSCSRGQKNEWFAYKFSYDFLTVTSSLQWTSFSDLPFTILSVVIKSVIVVVVVVVVVVMNIVTRNAIYSSCLELILSCFKSSHFMQRRQHFNYILHIHIQVHIQQQSSQKAYAKRENN